MLFDHAFLGLAVGVALLVAAFGWQARRSPRRSTSSLYLGLSGSVNSIAHTFGRRTVRDVGTNVQWLALITAGEGLHNNHHAAPTSARFSLSRCEFDPSWLPSGAAASSAG